MKGIEILKANVRGHRDRTMATKCQALVLDLLDHNANIACLIDTHLDSSLEGKISTLWKGDSFFAHSDNAQAGIAILTRDIDISKF